MRRKRVLFGVSVLFALTCVLLASGQAGEDAGCWVARETIYIYGNTNLCFANGVVSGCGDRNSPYVIEGLRIIATGCDYGINIENTTKHIVIRNCIIEGASVAGIRLGSASNVVIEGCQLLRNEQGILLESANDNAIIGNLIAENYVGAVLTLGSKENVLSKNSFVGNGRSAHDPGGRNLWYCGMIGNYWDDYCGIDKDCNGIGDSTYTAPVVDRYPLIGSPWGCGLPLADNCGAAHCARSTDYLRAIGCDEPASCGQPCDTPCGAPTCQPVCGHPCATPCGAPTCLPVGGQPCATPCGAPTCRPACGQPCVIPCGAPTCWPACGQPCAVPCGLPTCRPVCAPSVTMCDTQILTCLQPQVTLTADFCPTRPTCEPCRIEWTRAGYGIVGTVRAITVNEPGTYTVTIVGADGCSVSDVVVVGADFDAPVVHATVDRELTCDVTEVTLRATTSGGREPCAIQWTTPGG